MTYSQTYNMYVRRINGLRRAIDDINYETTLDGLGGKKKKKKLTPAEKAEKKRLQKLEKAERKKVYQLTSKKAREKAFRQRGKQR